MMPTSCNTPLKHSAQNEQQPPKAGQSETREEAKCPSSPPRQTFAELYNQVETPNCRYSFESGLGLEFSPIASEVATPGKSPGHYSGGSLLEGDKNVKDDKEDELDFGSLFLSSSDSIITEEEKEERGEEQKQQQQEQQDEAIPTAFEAKLDAVRAKFEKILQQGKIKMVSDIMDMAAASVAAFTAKVDAARAEEAAIIRELFAEMKQLRSERDLLADKLRTYETKEAAPRFPAASPPSTPDAASSSPVSLLLGSPESPTSPTTQITVTTGAPVDLLSGLSDNALQRVTASLMTAFDALEMPALTPAAAAPTTLAALPATDNDGAACTLPPTKRVSTDATPAPSSPPTASKNGAPSVSSRISTTPPTPTNTFSPIGRVIAARRLVSVTPPAPATFRAFSGSSADAESSPSPATRGVPLSPSVSNQQPAMRFSNADSAMASPPPDLPIGRTTTSISSGSAAAGSEAARSLVPSPFQMAAAVKAKRPMAGAPAASARKLGSPAGLRSPVVGVGRASTAVARPSGAPVMRSPLGRKSPNVGKGGMKAGSSAAHRTTFGTRKAVSKAASMAPAKTAGKKASTSTLATKRAAKVQPAKDKKTATAATSTRPRRVTAASEQAPVQQTGGAMAATAAVTNRRSARIASVSRKNKGISENGVAVTRRWK